MFQLHPSRVRIYLVLAFILTCAFFTYAWVWVNNEPVNEPDYGITFSSHYASELGLDIDEAYQAFVSELGVSNVRLSLYWSDIEKSQGEFDWSIPDRLVALSEVNDVDLTVVVGMKVPRWPECYVPDWAEGFSDEVLHTSVYRFIETAVKRYRTSDAVVRWQVENEPFFPYGECPQISVEQFQERIALVRSLDARPIMVTVSGELGPWLDSAQAADVLGISMYRQTWNDLYGYFVYPIAPEFYTLRASLVQADVASVIVSELQAEPWFPEPISHRPLTDWYENFTAEMFQSNLRFAREAGLPEVYFWGAEWWYALKQAGDDRLWNVAKEIFINEPL